MFHRCHPAAAVAGRAGREEDDRGHSSRKVTWLFVCPRTLPPLCIILDPLSIKILAVQIGQFCAASAWFATSDLPGKWSGSSLTSRTGGWTCRAEDLSHGLRLRERTAPAARPGHLNHPAAQGRCLTRPAARAPAAGGRCAAGRTGLPSPGHARRPRGPAPVTITRYGTTAISLRCPAPTSPCSSRSATAPPPTTTRLKSPLDSPA